MKLSIVILCWNDLKVIGDCLSSIYKGTHSTNFEIIVSDNGSTDGSIDFIRNNFPQVRLLENGTNLRFAKGNNVGIDISQGEYVLILNPDTSVVAAVELDDAMHAREIRRQADARKTHALKSAGIPWIRWNAESLPDAAGIMAAISAQPPATRACS